MALFHRPPGKTQPQPTWRRDLPRSDDVHFDRSLRTAAELTAQSEQPPSPTTRPAVARKGSVAA